jgi:hypothetical protein
MRRNPRPELAWRHVGTRRLEELHAELLSRGYSAAFVNGLIGWIITGGRCASSATAAAYRRALRALPVSPPTPSASEAGYAHPRLLGTVSITGAAGAAAAHLAAAGAPLERHRGADADNPRAVGLCRL